MTSISPAPIMAAMSGGVDSSVAAALLVQQGHAVTGVTMSFTIPPPPGTLPVCPGRESISDAQCVAAHCGISHHVLDCSAALESLVIRDFCDEYLRGYTPNPCVRCNQFLKFGLLLEHARAMGCDYLATGHYARVERRAGGLVHLLAGADRSKDQSYFLYRLGQDQLRHVLFPLGALAKTHIRELATTLHLPTATKPESQEVCFVPQDDYRAFLSARAPDAPTLQPGDIVDLSGTRLGTHPGAALFTIGQRAGLRIAHAHPLYVVRIDAAHNRVVVGARSDAESSVFTVQQVTWCAAPVDAPRDCLVKIRFNHRGAPARIIPHAATVRVECHQPVFAVTPGQSAVFYDGDELLGGGIISSHP